MGFQNDDEEEEDTQATASDDSAADDESEDDASPESVTPSDADKATDGSAPPSDDDKQQAIKDYLTQQYGNAASTSGIEDAKASARRKNSIAGIGEGLESMFKARSMAYGGAGVNHGLYDGIRQDGQQGIQQAQAARQAAIQDFVTKNQLGRQAAEDTQKQKGWDVTNDANDPDSKQSQIARHVWENANPGMKLGEMPEWGGMSANDMALIKDPIDLKAKLDERATAAAQTAEWHRANVDSRNQATAAAKEGKAARDDAKSEAAASKDQGKNYVKMDSEIHGAGRAPPDIRQALKDQQSIDKANKLFEGRDLNSLSKSEAALAASELEKIATGGSGTEAGRQGLDPHSFEEQWSAFKNKFVGANGAVEPAQIGAFLQQQKDYLQGLKTVTDDRLNKYGRGVHDTYLEAGQISPEQSEKYQARHPELFPELQKTANQPAAPANKQAAAPAHPVGSMVTLKSGKKYKVIDAAGNLEEIPTTAQVGAK